MIRTLGQGWWNSMQNHFFLFRDFIRLLNTFCVSKGETDTHQLTPADTSTITPLPHVHDGSSLRSGEKQMQMFSTESFASRQLTWGGGESNSNEERDMRSTCTPHSGEIFKWFGRKNTHTLSPQHSLRVEWVMHPRTMRQMVNARRWKENGRNQQFLRKKREPERRNAKEFLFSTSFFEWKQKGIFNSKTGKEKRRKESVKRDPFARWLSFGQRGFHSLPCSPLLAQWK